MQNTSEEIARALSELLVAQKPRKVLILSRTAEQYGRLIYEILEKNGQNPVLDRVALDQNESAETERPVFRKTFVNEAEITERYDFVLVTDLMELLPAQTAVKLVRNLLSLTGQSVFAVTPILCRDTENGEGKTYRKIHPTLFKEFDFSCVTVGAYQLYHFFAHKAAPRPKNYDIARWDTRQERRLRIAYILPHKNLTGGLKCLLEQMRQLSRRGHLVYAIYKNRKGEEQNRSALPNWCDLDPQKDLGGQIVLGPDARYTDYIDCYDVVMLGFMNHLADFTEYTGKTRIFYWEQGYEGLYGDYGRLLPSNDTELCVYRKLYASPVNYLAVTELVADILKSKYGIEADVLHNGIDTEFYRYRDSGEEQGVILLVGNPVMKFKGFEFAMQVLGLVWSMGYRFRVRWACQLKPTIQNAPFPIEYFVLQPQHVLAQLYREADLFLFTSLYESFPMPPFEAMASGLPVVSTDCGGIRTYAVEEENMLLVRQGDVQAAALAVIRLLKDKALRDKLSVNGRRTAEKFSFQWIASDIEKYFYAALSQKDAEPCTETDAAGAFGRRAPMTLQKEEGTVPTDGGLDVGGMGQRELILYLIRIGSGAQDGSDMLDTMLEMNLFSKEIFDNCIKRYVPFKAKAYNAVGTAFYNRGQKQTAVEFFSAAFSEDKKLRDAAFNLAYCLVEFKEKELALKVLSDCGCADAEMTQLKNIAMAL